MTKGEVSVGLPVVKERERSMASVVLIVNAVSSQMKVRVLLREIYQLSIFLGI